MNKVIQVLLRRKLIILAAIALSGCPITVNLNVATDKPITLVVDKPIELKLDAGIAITDLPPIRVTQLPPIKVGIAPKTKKK